MKKVYLGFYGFGTVGTGAYTLIERERGRIMEEYGVELVVKRILVSDTMKLRPVMVDRKLLTHRAADVYEDKDISVVLEFMGGESPAYEYGAAALAAGKSLVTANKVMLAAHWGELAATAELHGTGLYFEASAMGGVPVIRLLLDSMAANPVSRIMGVVNGTTNFMLSKMEGGMDYDAALGEAQRLGYAEPDPTADVSGTDAAAKLVILGSLAFNRSIKSKNIYCTGIEGLHTRDIELAGELGYAVKLAAIAERTADGLTARVHPALIPLTSPLARVRGVNNGLLITGAAAELFIEGPGAGAEATASAMIADAVNAAFGLSRPAALLKRDEAVVISDWETAYYIRLRTDAPEAVAAMAGAVARVYSNGELAIITKRTRESSLSRLVSELSHRSIVSEITSILRVE